MGPRDWFETIKEVAKKIGSTGDTGGSTTTGTVMGKVNAILAVLKNGGMPVVKSIQYGNFNAGSASWEEKTIAISPVNADKSIVILNAAHPNSSGKQGCMLKALSATSLVVYVAYVGIFS